MGFTPSIPGKPPGLEPSDPSQLRPLGSLKPHGRGVCVCVHACLLGEKAIGSVSLRAVDQKEAGATVVLTCNPGSGRSVVSPRWSREFSTWTALWLPIALLCSGWHLCGVVLPFFS